MAPPLVLWVLLAARATALSCVCTPSECEEVLEWECPGGGVVWDACGCCRVCARVEDEPCGGPDGFHGSCAPGLHCVLDPSQLLPQRAQRGEARGTCKRECACTTPLFSIIQRCFSWLRSLMPCGLPPEQHA
ncbi:hypothetical protein J437_LFUL006350 [Ladona fulva]|uniref:IGFBP N-terminal domain-containing protein n=1 Tax=Ladona fulva TaxID=123851 RepID=A0A8K0K4R5_LADFU|nr:hypothetical protein J437_LFUL006350 [Ladona fulva]